MSDTPPSPPPPEEWAEWLSALRNRYIAAQGWSAKEAKRYIRDVWVVVRGVYLHDLTEGDQRPADAIQIFEILTFGGWKRPIEITERLTGLVSKAMTSQRAPRDIVMGLLSQIEHAEGRDESDEVLRHRHTAALWARGLLALCEHEAFSEVAGTDLFWSTILFALLTGRRHAILEICRDPQVFADLAKAQAFQSGRSPDELSKCLEARWLELRADLGRIPTPEEVIEAAGGRWDEIDDCYEFDDLKSLPSITRRGLYERLKDIRRKHAP